jgi:molybdenum cofactor cytidylyltransferase
VNSSSDQFRAFAVIPAAGRSLRMGRPKLLLPWRGSTLIDAQLSAWSSSRVESVTIVVHPDDALLADHCRQKGANVIVPDTPPSEMKVSVAHALRSIAARYEPASHDAWLLAPADMPLLTSVIIDQVLSAYNPQQPSIVVPKYLERHGHPVLFPWALAAEVDKLPANSGLKALRDRHGAQVVAIQDEGILEDIDTPDEYSRLRP